MKHLREQWVAGKISQKMALVQILLNLQTDAAHFGKSEQQLAKLVWVSWEGQPSVLHQCSVNPLLSLLHLSAILNRLNIYSRGKMGY